MNKESYKKYYQEHREEIKKRIKKYYHKNRAKIIKNKKMYNQRRKKEREKYRQKHKEESKKYNREYIQSDIGRYKTIESNAKKRNYEFHISFTEYKMFFWKKSCYYCGQKNTTGIDRVDNSQSYIIGNCVPCCIICNSAKHAQSKDDFIRWVKKLYNHLKKSGLLL